MAIARGILINEIIAISNGEYERVTSPERAESNYARILSFLSELINIQLIIITKLLSELSLLKK